MIDKDTCVVIPARCNSSRIPTKLLIKINNKTVIEHTIQRIIESGIDIPIYVITDSDEIHNITNNIPNVTCIVNKDEFRNGTERISANIDNLRERYNYYLILHADQPFLNSDIIQEVYNMHTTFDYHNCSALTVYNEISHEASEDNSIAKIVLNNNNEIMYISRQSIPYTYKKNNNVMFKKHISICIFNYNSLKNYNIIPEGENQEIEENEWLRFIENGYKIKAIKTDLCNERDINTEDDLKYLLSKYENV